MRVFIEHAMLFFSKKRKLNMNEFNEHQHDENTKTFVFVWRTRKHDHAFFFIMIYRIAMIVNRNVRNVSIIIDWNVNVHRKQSINNIITSIQNYSNMHIHFILVQRLTIVRIRSDFLRSFSLRERTKRKWAVKSNYFMSRRRRTGTCKKTCHCK